MLENFANAPLVHSSLHLLLEAYICQLEHIPAVMQRFVWSYIFNEVLPMEASDTSVIYNNNGHGAP